MISFKRWSVFFKQLIFGIKREYKAFLKLEELRNVRNEYVPKYGLRTEQEHEIIRRNLRVKFDPKNCDHLKGDPFKSRFSRDYNMSLHTFPDGTRRVRCLSCGRKWFSADSNWLDALKMVNRSTNSPSGSEIAPKVCNHASCEVR